MSQQDLFSNNNFTLEKNHKKKIKWLSHSAIEELNRCPRCFWLSYKEGIKLPEGIQSRLANRFDSILKKYFNTYRNQDRLPPLIEGKIKGRLKKPFKETFFYKFNDDFGFYGKLDECLVNENGDHIPVDFKTASSDPREKEILSAYQNQIDEYLFLLEENGLKVANFGYLIYFFPEMTVELSDGFPMIIHIVKIERKIKDIKKRIEKAVNILQGLLPKSADDCIYCRWFEKVKGYY
ncbi:MAG: PD-(D/E)XK nuclease family protein [Patescibacteria group bacterium]|nr:PD-(D/E)XK nuclease family protein [Patescibacteria group bacterium]